MGPLDHFAILLQNYKALSNWEIHTGIIYQFYYCLYLLMEYHHMSTIYSRHFPFLLKAAATTPFHIQAEVTMKTNFFGSRVVCAELLPLIKPQGESDWSPDCSASGKIWVHLALVSGGQPPCRSCSALLASTVSPPSRVSCTLRSLDTLPRSLVLSVHLLFAHLALSSLSHLSSEVSSSKWPSGCSVPITGAVPSGVLPRPSLSPVPLLLSLVEPAPPPVH